MMPTLTLASEARYADWLADVDELLAKRGLDVAEAHDFYAFREAYEAGEHTRDAVSEYQEWMRQEGLAT